MKKNEMINGLESIQTKSIQLNKVNSKARLNVQMVGQFNRVCDFIFSNVYLKAMEG